MQGTFFHFFRGFRNQDGNHFIFLKSRVSRRYRIDHLRNKNKIHETNATHTKKQITTVANLFVEGPDFVPFHVNICLWWTLMERYENKYYLTIIPRAGMGSWAIDSEAMRARGIIVLVKSNQVVQKYRDKTTLASKTRFSHHCFGFQSRRFSLLV